MYVPQRSSLWHEIRKTVRLTGSTFAKAVGLNGLPAQKEHHHVFVNGQEPPPILEVQKMLDHGKNFKIRGIATLVGQIMPALYHHVMLFLKLAVYLETHRQKMLI